MSGHIQSYKSKQKKFSTDNLSLLAPVQFQNIKKHHEFPQHNNSTRSIKKANVYYLQFYLSSLMLFSTQPCFTVMSSGSVMIAKVSHVTCLFPH